MSKPAKIFKQGHLLSINSKPEILMGLARVLCFETHCAQESYRFGSTIETKTIPLWQPKYPKVSIWDEPKKENEFPPEITVLAGLEGLVLSTLKHMQVPFILSESRPKSQPELVEGQHKFEESIHFIKNQERGTIRFERSSKILTSLIVDVIKSFPNARILLALSLIHISEPTRPY